MSLASPPGGLTKGNHLERSGDWLGAVQAYLAYYRDTAADSPLRKIALDNIRRVFARSEPSRRDRILGELLVRTPEILTGALGGEQLVRQPGKPLVTVVVPCFNVEKYLPACIESIRRQTLDSFECVLVDDFATDSTAAICKAARESDKRIRFIQHRANGGPSAARNTGLRYARGRYVTFLDSDDLLAPDSLKNRAAALARLDASTAVAGVFDFSQTIEHDFAGVIQGADAKYKGDYVDFVSAQGECPFNANQPMLKRSVLVEMGGFPENHSQSEDWRLWSKILRAGYLFLPVRSIGSGYRQTPGSNIRRALMTHLENSVRNYYRAHRDYAAETEPAELRYENLFAAAPLFRRDAGFYKAQAGLLSRVINFFGLEASRALADGEAIDIDNLFVILDGAIPDRASSVGRFAPKAIHGWLENGARRFHSGRPVPADQRERFEQFAFSIIGRLYGPDLPMVVDTQVMPPRAIEGKAPIVVDFVFFPHKAYHTRSFQLLLPLLERAGLTYRFVDSTIPYRDEKAYSAELAEYFVSYNEFIFSRIVPRIVVCMDDWDTVVKPVVIAARKRGIETVGIVEGVQDYEDADTGRKRNAYREVANVFLPGAFDRKYLATANATLWVTGVQRLDGLDAWQQRRAARTTPRERLVVVNVNFSYGVMTDRRDQWLADIAQACRAAGRRMVVSQHPQDTGDLSAYEVSKQPLYDLLVEAECLVSRFSGAILESLVIGCPVVYYNGHHEKLDKFHDSLGGYSVADDVESLAAVFRSATFERHDSREFLRQHCDRDGADPRNSVEKTVDALIELSARTQPSLDSMLAFKRDLGA